MKPVIRLLTGMLLLCWVASANAQLVPPGQLDFGPHRLFTTSPPMATTLRNSGNQPLSVVAVSPATGVYARVGGSCGATPFSIAAQASCTITHTFRPDALVSFYQTNTVTLAGGALVNFGLAGRGAQGRLTISPVFGLSWLSTPIGMIGDEKLVVLGNDGPVPIQIFEIRTSSVPAVSAFVRTGGSCPAPPFEIGVGNCSIAYTFVPAQLGESTMDVIFRTDVSSYPTSLRGEGGPELPIFANGFDASAPAPIQ